MFQHPNTEGVMTDEVLCLSSMATRQLLTDLGETVLRGNGVLVRLRSAGGVETAEQVRDGAVADVVILAQGALAGLATEGLVHASTIRPLFVSDVVAAVPTSASGPRVGTEDELRAALLGARRVAYSTGPSGSALLALIERWGVMPRIAGRLVEAPPGVPVGELLARGDADLGFQQRSELMDVEGVDVLGTLPGEAAIRSTFSGGVLATCRRPEVAARVLDLLGSPESSTVVNARGMVLARPDR